MSGKTITACAFALCSAGAYAQSSVTLYGIVDSSIRYSTNEDASGHHRLSAGDGAITGSRFGFRGAEDLGSGTKAVFTLEGGFNPGTGALGQGGLQFGRSSFVGLENDTYGSLYLGRQYTIAHVVVAKWDAFQLANNAILSFEGGNISGLRNNNMAKYVKTFNGLTVSGQYTFGGVAGDISAGSGKGFSVTYDRGPLSIGAFYQVSEDVSTAYFGAISAAMASKQTVWGLGGTYQAGPVRLYFHYTNNRLDKANYKNYTYSIGANYQVTPAFQLIGSLYDSKLKHPGADGNRFTSGLVFDYFLSKTSDVYVELDYTKLTGGWVPLANNSALGSASFYGNNNRFGAMLGVRHRF